MKSKIYKASAAVMAAAMTMGMCGGVPVFAATTYTPVAGTSTTFVKNLIMDEGDSVPNATFSFTVAPGAAVSADTSDNQVFQVLPGVGTPTIADVTFAPGDTTTLTANASGIDILRTEQDRTGTAGTDTVQLDAGEKYAQKTATVDFSGITFDEPGIYRYIITETASAAHATAGIIHDTDVDRVLDVYVTDDGTGSLVVSGYVMHTDINSAATPAISNGAGSAAVTEAWIYDGTEYATEADAQAAASQAGDADPQITHREASATVPAGSMGTDDVAAAGDALADKTDGFTNEFASKDLKIEKEVTGNQASRDKWFALTVTCSDVADADTYVVSLADDNNAATNDGFADATSGTTSATKAANQGQTNPTSVTGAQLKAGVTFYLQHGQSVVIRGLSPAASYTLTEDAEDYASSVLSGDTNSGVIGTVAASDKMAEAGFLNTRDGIIPTGVAIAIIPGIALAGIGGFGVLSSMRKREEED